MTDGMLIENAAFRGASTVGRMCRVYPVAKTEDDVLAHG